MTKRKNPLFWLGPGVLSFKGKDILVNGEIPSDFPGKKLEHLKKLRKAGNLVVPSTVSDQERIVDLQEQLKNSQSLANEQSAEIEKLQSILEDQAAETTKGSGPIKE